MLMPIPPRELHNAARGPGNPGLASLPRLDRAG